MTDIASIDEISTDDFARMLKTTDLAIIPVGSIEVHGPHAPLGLDNFLGEELAKRLAVKLKAALFPPIRYGVGHECFDTTEWPGTIGLSAETLCALYTDVGIVLSKIGFRRIMFVSSHYNNIPALQIAAAKIYGQTGTAVGILEPCKVAQPEMAEVSKVTHADQVETSMLLVTPQAHLVDLRKAVPNKAPEGWKPPTQDESALWERALHDRYTYVITSDYMTAGNYGDPRLANKEDGERFMAIVVEYGTKMAEVLRRHVKKK
jgi:creatinine amidohydrolase